MRMAWSRKMATSQEITIKYKIHKVEDNNIGSLGCEWIAKGDWKELHTVELGLKSLIKIATVLEMKAV